MEHGRVLTTPQSIVWEHVSSLQEIIEEIDIVADEKTRKRKAALCLHLSVLIVETFLNIYFRLLIEEDKYQGYKVSLLNDIQCRKSLDYKIKNWPKQLFGKSLDLTSGALKQFMDMKEMRNSIMHYKYTWESVTVDKIEINGLTDISFYESLNKVKAMGYFNIMIGTIENILFASGIAEDKLPFSLQRWTGIITWNS